MKRQQPGKAALLAAVATLFTNFSAESAGVFKELSVDAAKSTAKQEGKLLVIDFTASWCGPCHKMEKTTWSDPSVQKWIAENAIAIQLDVDKEKDTSQSFKIMAMPSMVVFAPKDYSQEFDRHVGYQTSSELLEWLNAVKKGETSLDVARHKIESLAGKGGEAEVKARLQYGRMLLDAGKYADAGEQLAWLWEQIPTQLPSAGGVRISLIANEIGMVSTKSTAAKSRFAALRDEAEKKNELLDFVVLNEVLNEKDRTLQWFDKVKDDPQAQANFKQVDFVLEGILIKNGRWKDVILLFPDPIAELKELAEKSPHVVQEMARMGIRDVDPFVRDAARIYAAALAAHRESDAKKIATEILKLRNNADMRKQLVATALAANEPRKDQLKWAAGDKELTARLQEALKTAKKK